MNPVVSHHAQKTGSLISQYYYYFIKICILNNPAQKAILIPWQLIMTQWQWRNSRPSRPCSARWHQNYCSANVDKKFFNNLKININTKIIHTCNLTPSSKETLCNFIAHNILELRRGRKMVLGAQNGSQQGATKPHITPLHSGWTRSIVKHHTGL